MAALTEDLVIEILSRLPVRSLLRFRCVSRSWCATIETRSFRYKHLKNKTNESRGCLWAQYFFPHTWYCLNAFFPDETLADSTSLPFDVPKFDSCMSFEMLHSSCNGIFLISNTYDMFALWNPATKEYSVLPNSGLEYGGHCWQECGGFGLDPITNDYKAVILRWCEDTDYIVGKVHTLGTEYWKDLGTDLQCFNIVLNRSSAYLNGFYYFLASHSRVISFDMATDVLQVIPQPNEIQLPPVGQWTDLNELLAVYRDRIALFKLGYEENYLNVWLLEEGSWTNRLSVGPLIGVKYPIGIWNDEELLLHSETCELFGCKLTTLEIRNLGLQGSYEFLGMNNYKESLISIKDECRYRCQRR